MSWSRVPALLLALVLQVAPVARVAQTLQAGAPGAFAIILRLAAAASAVLGGVDAVSGASTTITSATTATGTNGVAFSYRITTGPQTANTFSATPLPTGLTCSATTGRITGTPTQSGTWTVLLTASDSGIASRTCTTNLALTIVSSGGGGTAPSITTQPSTQTVNAGANVSFSVGASGTAPLTYQWNKNGTPIAGATSSTLSLVAVTSADAATYTVVVSNAVGTATSSGAVLTVNTAPSITTQPSSQTVTAGANVTFSVVATGTATLTYQWSRNGVPIGGATSSSLSLSTVSASDAATYSVVVSNAVGSATSSGAVLTVDTPPTITTQPSNQTVNAGASVSFSVAASGTAPLIYQWSKNGSPIGGATSSTLSLSSVSASDAATYAVVVSNVAGSAVSVGAVLTVNTAPGITTPPAAQAITNGGSVTFTAVVSGTAPFTYQWNKDGAPITGATASTLTLSPVSTNDAGTYTVVVSNGVGSATSAGAVLTVTVPPTVTSQPRSTIALTGGNPTFTVTATGTGPLTYQWFFNGAVINGATTSVLALLGVTTNNNGSYFVVVSNVAGTVASSHAFLAVRPPPQPPTIVSNPVTLIRYAGDTADFSVVAAGTGPLYYQWQFKGTNLPGATSSSLSRSNVSLLDAGAYTAVVTNAVGSATSRPAWLLVRVAPSPTPGDAAAPSPNAAPVPNAVVAGQDALGTNFNRVLLLAPGQTETQRILDASGSYDPERDPLQFTWQADLGNGSLQAFATGAVTTNTLVAGEYHLVLTVSDRLHPVALRLDLSVLTPLDFSLDLLQEVEDLNLPEPQGSVAREPWLGVVQALQRNDFPAARARLNDAAGVVATLLQSGAVSPALHSRLAEGVQRLISVVP